MIGFYGNANAPNALVEALSPWTGQAAQTQAGQGFQALVQALPGIQAQVHQLANPGTLQALVRQEARLREKLTGETHPGRRAQIEANLGLLQEQIAQLRAALAPATPNVVSIQPVPTRNAGWIGGGVALGLVVIGGLAYIGSRR